LNPAAGAPRIRVLVVDDSPVLRELIVHLLEEDPAIQVIGTAANGQEAVEAVQRTRPDVVAMDYHMPTLDGMGATRRIMETHPVPIVIVSGSSVPGEAVAAFRLLEAGALAVVEKPPGIGHPGHPAAVAQLVQTVKLMAEVKVVRRWPAHKRKPETAAAPTPMPRTPALAGTRLVVIGASTGGPVVLKTVLLGLPKSLPAPVFIVQHIAAGFTQGLADWLTQATGFPVQVAQDGQWPLPGHAYLAPEGVHMKIGVDGTIVLDEGPPENGHRPSVSQLFRSAAPWSPHVVGVLLTGMGRDGAAELKLLKQQGAVTLVQDEASSVVHGMPGAAIELDAATHILDPLQMASILAGLAG